MFDVAIVGSGPAALSAAINLKALGKSSVVFSAGDNNLIKAKEVNNHLGFISVTGQQMMDSFDKHLKACGTIRINEKVSSIVSLTNKFILNANSKLYEATSVILCIGIAVFNQLEHESELLGKGISYCAVCDGMLYRGKKAIVWGIEKGSYKEANMLDDIGVNVIYVSSNDENELLNKGIEFAQGKVTAVQGNSKLEKVFINERAVEADALFILRPVIPAVSLIDGLHVDGAFISVDNKMKTNIAGVFAAGDCTGKPLQISKAIGEGQIAAYSAAEYINKKEK